MSTNPILAAAPSIRRHGLNDKRKRAAFAAAVVARRKELGLSRVQFTKALGISYSQTTHIEVAHHWPSLTVYARICEVLKVGKPPLL